MFEFEIAFTTSKNSQSRVGIELGLTIQYNIILGADTTTTITTPNTQTPFSLSLNYSHI